MIKNVIYLDNNATTRVAPEVVEAMKPFLTDYYGNPSSMHTFGGQVRKLLNQAKEQIADLIGARSIEEIIITANATESNNAAFWGTLESYPEKRHIITTKVEHPSVLNVAQFWERKGYRVSWLGVDSQGRLDIDELRAAITPHTALVSIMYANNETGVVFPIEEIGKIVKAHGVVFHVDGVQAIGKIPINLENSTIDLLSLSGHKLHAPKGVGVLYIRRGTRFQPYMIGGHQEYTRRAGTENVPGIIGLGKACELAKKSIKEETSRVKYLRDKLEQAILMKVPDSRVNGAETERLPNTSSISFEGVEGESILLMLDREGICASSGSACTTGSIEPSHVLRAMGVPYNYVHGTVRLSLSRYTTEEEIDTVIEVLPGIIERLRELSPLWKSKR
ncbi:cysteine desulfurase NifS [Candidatus Sumerlaeota bacterium]|nr:cysteine desulfurase NifS [Candidatus Sumerlaeota bacterium]